MKYFKNINYKFYFICIYVIVINLFTSRVNCNSLHPSQDDFVYMTISPAKGEVAENLYLYKDDFYNITFAMGPSFI